VGFVVVKWQKIGFFLLPFCVGFVVVKWQKMGFFFPPLQVLWFSVHHHNSTDVFRSSVGGMLGN
jgi:hypothetical protein